MAFVRGKSLFTKLTMFAKYKSSFLEFPNSEMSSSEIATLFEEWMAKHGKIYKTPEEKLHRFEIFKKRFEYGEKEKSEFIFRVSLNGFSDWTKQELEALYRAMDNPVDDPKVMAAKLRDEESQSGSDTSEADE